MDRKSIILLALTALLFLSWPTLTRKIYPDIPVKQTNSVAIGTNSTLPGAVITSAGTNLIAAGTNIAAFATNAPVGKEENVVVQNDLATYHFSSFGGGLKLVEFKKYKSIVGCKAEKAATNPPASVNKKATWPMFTIQDNDGLVGDNVFRLSSTGQTVRAEKTLTNGVTLVKDFQILSNYQIKVTTRWENHGQAPARVPGRLMVIGTATPTGAYDELRTLGLDWYDGKKAQRIDRTFFEPSGWLFKSPAKDIYSGGQSNIQWAATHNRFFTTVVTPETTPQQIQGRKVDLPAPTAEETAGDARKVVNPSGIVGSFALPEITIPAGVSFVEHYDAYAGPKEYKILSRLRNDVDLVMNLTGFFGWFAKILLMSMNGLYSFGISYGWAIVVITVILKLLFYPLTAASTRSMKRMSSLQPQMKAIQEKYKDDPAKMNQKLQEFMKEHRINPLGSCLPILLTIPVFGGFWFMLNSAIELRGAQFLWACDLSAPDTLFVIPGLNIPINGFAIIMIVTMMWQSHMTPPSPGVDPAQQKMMRYMPLVIVPFIYNQAAGLTLYWSVQNLLSIIQMKLTKDKPEDPAKPGAGKPVPIAPAPRRKA
jgi:YidC/Oxa1 family membrane protein insertase